MTTRLSILGLDTPRLTQDLSNVGATVQPGAPRYVNTGGLANWAGAPSSPTAARCA